MIAIKETSNDPRRHANQDINQYFGIATQQVHDVFNNACGQTTNRSHACISQVSSKENHGTRGRLQGIQHETTRIIAQKETTLGRVFALFRL